MQRLEPKRCLVQDVEVPDNVERLPQRCVFAKIPIRQFEHQVVHRYREAVDLDRAASQCAHDPTDAAILALIRNVPLVVEDRQSALKVGELLVIVQVRIRYGIEYLDEGTLAAAMKSRRPF